jgi:hypothetical protein
MEFYKRPLKSKQLDVIKNMPPLYHKIPGEPFDILKSETVAWLIKQPDILNYLWENVVRRTYDVKYDHDMEKWVGIDYQQPCPHGYEDWDDCPDCRH